MKNAIKNITNHNEWRKRMSKPGFIRILPDEEILMKKGPIYFSGVDKKYRPILVINAEKVKELNVCGIFALNPENLEGSGGKTDGVCGGRSHQKVLFGRQGRELDHHRRFQKCVDSVSVGQFQAHRNDFGAELSHEALQNVHGEHALYDHSDDVFHQNT